MALLNWVNSSATQVFSMSKTRMVPEAKPHVKIGSWGWAATHRGWSIGEENSTTCWNYSMSQSLIVPS